MARDATLIAVDRTEFLIPAGAVETRRLITHCIQKRTFGSDLSRAVLNRLDHPPPVVLAAKLLLHPEQLYEQHRAPDFTDDPADDRVTFTQRDGEALVLLLPHLFAVVG